MTGEIIQSFLVGLGFGVDEASLGKFNKALASAAVKVTALYTATQVAASGIFFGISKISEGFETMGYEMRLIAPQINKTLQLRQALMSAYHAAGVNLTQAVKESIAFNFSLAKTKFTLEAIYKSVGLKFIPLLTKQMDVFRKGLLANMPKIQNALQKFVAFIFKAFEATTILGARVWSILERVWEFFKKLHEATDGWSTVILGVVAAWKLLNLSFLATPLGMLLTGLVALLALYDDFMTYKEGGESLFNWGPAIPVINAITKSLDIMWDVLKGIGSVLYNIFDGFMKLLNMDFDGFVSSWAKAGEAILGVFGRVWDLIKSIGGTLGALGGLLGNVLGNKNVAANIGSNNPTTQPLASPVSSQVQNSNSNSNQSVNQQTSIIVQGSADANATGKAIAGQQNRVNFDMARNLRGSAR